jgi:hypothetical protein
MNGVIHTTPFTKDTYMDIGAPAPVVIPVRVAPKKAPGPTSDPRSDCIRNRRGPGTGYAS